MKILISSALVILLIGLSACTPTAPGESIQATSMILQSEKQREQSPEVAPADTSSLTDGNSVFDEFFNILKTHLNALSNLFNSKFPSICPHAGITCPITPNHDANSVVASFYSSQSPKSKGYSENHEFLQSRHIS